MKNKINSIIHAKITEKLSDKEKIQKVIDIIAEYGGYGDAQHKQSVIDKILCVLVNDCKKRG